MKIKKILILYKKSTYKHLILDQRRRLNQTVENPRIADRFMSTHVAHYQTLRQVAAFLKSQKVHFETILRGRKKDFSDFDLIITVGGDGTFLEGASRVTHQLILGINSDPQWSVGRFCFANSANFRVILGHLFEGKVKIKIFNRMRIRLHKSGHDAIVLNDILVCHRNPAAMSRYYLEFKGRKEEQRSSGVWISTGAGSTGAIHSAGGKKMNESSLKLQYVVREPYAGKFGKILNRSAVFAEKDGLKLTSLMKDGLVFIDGAHINEPFVFGETLTVGNSSYPLKLIVA